MSSPIILLIPGAWHEKEAVDPLAETLRGLGHSVQTAQLESVGGYGTIKDDAAALESTMSNIADGDHDIIVVVHSYAGAAVASALKPCAKKYRQEQGKSGGIIGIVYMAAFILPEGVSIQDTVGGTLPQWQKIDEDAGTITVLNPTEMFYADCSTEIAANCEKKLKHHSVASFRTPNGPGGPNDPAFNGRRAYIRTINDAAIPADGQLAMVHASGVEWEVEDMQTSHSPFLSQTKEVAGFIDGLSKKWAV